MAKQGFPKLDTVRPTWASRRFGAKEATWLTLAFWGFTFVVFQAPGLKNGGLTLWETVGYVFVVAMGFSLSMAAYLVIRLTQTLPLSLRILLIGGASVAVSMLHSLLDHLIFVAAADVFGAPSKMPPLIDGFFFNIWIYVWVYGLYATIIGLAITATLMRDQERRLAAATAAAQEAQLAALRFQINPHFLFNTLNAVTSLIGSGRNVEAETVVVRLSEFFRASLTSAPGDLVRLEEELDVIGSYLDIEAARFGERLIVDIDFPDKLRQALTPHFLLQPLAENAVKHGVARSKQPVTISVRAKGQDNLLAITVSDDAGGATIQTPAANGTGVGLANVRARLQALYGDDAALTIAIVDGAFVAKVVMPLKFEGKAKRAAA